MSRSTAEQMPLVLANTVVNAPLTAKGHERATAILDCALDLLAEKGYASVSLSEVGRRTGIAKGNVQYYFPTNAALMRGALAVQVNRLKARWQNSLNGQHLDGRTKLSKLILTDIAVSSSEKHKSLALEKWAYANRDPEVQAIVHDWYLWVIETYRDIVLELRPDLSESQALQLAALVNALLEGSTPFFGRFRLRLPESCSMTSALEQAIWAMISGYARHSD